MKHLLTGAAMMVLFAVPAFAESPTPQNQPSAQTNRDSSPNQNLVAAQKIKKDLQSAGFTNVKVVAESFVVQAKSRDGDPVLMTIGPHGMSVFEAMNSNNSSSDQSTTGSASSNHTNSGSHSSTSQSK
jgi:hypothetical protein